MIAREYRPRQGWEEAFFAAGPASNDELLLETLIKAELILGYALIAVDGCNTEIRTECQLQTWSQGRRDQSLCCVAQAGWSGLTSLKTLGVIDLATLVARLVVAVASAANLVWSVLRHRCRFQAVFGDKWTYIGPKSTHL